MKNKILFTLILMVSCLGILGMGEKGEAASCSNSYCVSTFSCCTGTVACKNSQFCPTSLDWCLMGTASEYKIKCDASCNCEDSPTLINMCTDYCCQLANKGNKNYKCKKGKCILTGECEDVKDQECVNINECAGGVCHVVSSGQNNCLNDLTCCKKGTCKTETTICDCKSSCTSWVTDSECGERGCKSSEKYQIRDCTWNGCKSGDCDIKQCKYFSDCETTIPNPCYWQDVDCGPTGGCKDTEMHQRCVPSGCSGGICNAEDTRCDSGHGCGGVVNNGDPSGEKPPSGGAVNFTNPLSTNSFEALIMGIINWILGIVVSLAILFLIIGGLMYIVSAGDEEKIKKAKNIILYSIIGLGVVILSWSIITELKDILGVQ